MRRWSVEQLVPVLKGFIEQMEVGDEINSYHVRETRAELSHIRGTEITMALQHLAGRGYLENCGVRKYDNISYITFCKVRRR